MTIPPHMTPPAGRSAEVAACLRAGVPEIATSRSRLRAMQLDDFHVWAEVFCTDRSRWMDGPYSKDAAFTEFAASAGSWLLRGFGGWTVEDLATRHAAGFVCIHLDPSVREPELGYFLSAEAEGRGLALEATSAARDWAWAQGLLTLVSYINPANLRSIRLAERLGARLDVQAEVPNLLDRSVYRHPRPDWTA